MPLTKIVKIYPTEEQIDVLWTISDFCRRAYNIAHEERDRLYKDEHKTPSAYDQQKWFTQYKKEYSLKMKEKLKILKQILPNDLCNYIMEWC